MRVCLHLHAKCFVYVPPKNAGMAIFGSNVPHPDRKNDARTARLAVAFKQVPSFPAITGIAMIAAEALIVNLMLTMSAH